MNTRFSILRRVNEVKFQMNDMHFAAKRYLCNMNSKIDIFVQLGHRLGALEYNVGLCAVIAEAEHLNGWFRRSDILRAIEAIRAQMLDRQQLVEWLAAYPMLPVIQPKEVLLITAGNIPLVGFFDMLCVLLSGHKCLLKPSTKDMPLTGYIVELLREIDADIPLTIDNGSRMPEAVIATGSDNANIYFRSRYYGIPSLLRGSRQSVAVLSGSESRSQMQGLSDDIFAYSGLGCRNVSILFVPQGYYPEIPVPDVNRKYYNNYLQIKAQFSVTNMPFHDLGAALIVDSSYPFNAPLSVVSCISYYDLSEVEAWLLEHDSELQCVVSECIFHPRRVAFGQTQSPSLTDYPDGEDVMQFLSGL